MKSIFSVSQPRAGHHVVEMMMRAGLGDGFRYCEFYTEPNCCQSIPCARLGEFAGAGFRLFMQKSHDHNLTDPIPETSDLILVQIREPTLRALSNYELDLESHHRQHTPEYLQYWLANEAFYVIGFWRKWIEPAMERRLLLGYEEFQEAPAESFRAIFSALDMPLGDDEVERAAGQIHVSSRDRSTPFKARTLEASPYFIASYFTEFMNLVAREAGYLGYPAWQEPGDPSGPVTALFRARTAMAAGHFDQALPILERHIARNEVDREVVALLVRAQLHTGHDEEAERVLARLMRDEPGFFDSYAMLAARAYKAGDIERARDLVRAAVSNTGEIQRTREFLQQDNFDDALLGELPEVPRPSVTRDAVIAGFRWILGREPEAETVIENHTRCPDNDQLRRILLRADEFSEILARLPQSQPSSDGSSEQVTRDDVIAALRWLYGRRPRSRDETKMLLDSASPAALRWTLLNSDEFERAYRRALTGH